MQRIQINQLLLIVAAVAVLAAMPVMADMLSTVVPIEDEQKPAQSSRAYPLGLADADEAALLQSKELPQRVQVGPVAYITGGIGDDERDQLDAIKPEYNVYVLNASKAGEYICNTNIVIRDQHGAEILGASAGPIFLAKLPAGSYSLAASRESQSQIRHIKVGGIKSRSLYLIW